MGLPKVKQPVFEMTLPSNGRTIRYRPFTVAEEKILLVAKESDDVKDAVNAYKAIINNCCLDQLDVDKLCSFDIEFLFINIRAKSVSNIVEAQIEDDGQKYRIDINLDNVACTKSSKDPNIKLTDTIGVLMRYPTFETLKTISSIDEASQTLSLLASCIEQIYEGDDVYETSNYTRAEIEEFITSLGMKELTKVKDFFEDMPKVYVDVEYTTKDGKTKTTRIEGINNFFG